MTGDLGQTAHAALLFRLGRQEYGLDLAVVERVLRAVAVTPLPRTPRVMLGIINVRGRLLPLLSIRRRFGKPQPAIRLSDCIILARVPGFTVGLLVDSIGGILEFSAQEWVRSGAIYQGTKHIHGAVKLERGTILIQDLGQFLSDREQQQVRKILQKAAGKSK